MSGTLSAQLQSAVYSLKEQFKKAQLDLQVNTKTVESIFPPHHKIVNELRASADAAAKMLEAVRVIARAREDGCFEQVIAYVAECDQIIRDTPADSSSETKRQLLLNRRAIFKAKKEASANIIQFVKQPFFAEVPIDSNGWGRWKARIRSDPSHLAEQKQAPLENLFITGISALDQQYLVMSHVDHTHA